MVLARNAEIDEFEAQARTFLVRARTCLAEGDLLQACEKGWGAAAHMTKAVALANGWQYESHDEFGKTLIHVARVSGHPEVRARGKTATDLHVNFYRRETLLDAEAIGDDLGEIEELLELLTPLLPD